MTHTPRSRHPRFRNVLVLAAALALSAIGIAQETSPEQAAAEAAAGAVPAPIEHAAPAPSAMFKLEQLAFMSGSWRSPDGSNEEHWMMPAGDKMIGMARLIAGDRTFFEYLRIEASPDGSIAYVAMPQGGKPTPFGLVSLENNRAVFENPAHDYPQRIIYSLGDDGNMTARIEGKQGGQDKYTDYPMIRSELVPPTSGQ